MSNNLRQTLEHAWDKAKAKMNKKKAPPVDSELPAAMEGKAPPKASSKKSPVAEPGSGAFRK